VASPFLKLIPFESLSPDFGRQLATTLARQHRMTLPRESSQLGTLHGSQIRDRIEQFAQIWSAIPNKPPLHFATDLGFAWLLSREWPTNRPVALVHGDLGMHNILIRDGNLAALLDWELMHLGDPAEDIGTAGPRSSSLSSAGTSLLTTTSRPAVIPLHVISRSPSRSPCGLTFEAASMSPKCGTSL